MADGKEGRLITFDRLTGTKVEMAAKNLFDARLPSAFARLRAIFQDELNVALT